MSSTTNDPSAPILVRFEDGIGHLTLNNPGRKNAITADMAHQIERFCARVDEDQDIGAVIVDARGDYFCSGADIRDLAAAAANPASTDSLRRTSALYSAFVRIGLLPVPTVAVVVGGAVGAGLNLALACDVLLVTPDAVLESGFLGRRIHPGGGHFSLLGRTLNRQQAIAVGALGAALSGTAAVRLGLAWAAYPGDEITVRARELVWLSAEDPALSRRVKLSADLELGPTAVPWLAALEVERGAQMWSFGRKGEEGWKHEPVPAARASGAVTTVPSREVP